MKFGFIAFTEAYWDKSYVGQMYADARSLLNELTKESQAQVVGPSAPLETTDQTRSALEELKNAGGRALVIHCSSFFSGDLPLVVGDFLREHPLPVVVWATRERGPGHMQGNTFTALHLFAAMLHGQRIRFKWVYGDARDAETVRAPLAASLRAWSVIEQLRQTRIGNIGGRAPGFYLCNYDEVALRRRFGVEIEWVELRALFARADKVSPAEVDRCLAKWTPRLDLGSCNRSSLEKGIRIYLAATTLAARSGYAALTLRCWPEFLVDYGASPISLKREQTVPVVFDSPILSTEHGGAVGPALETAFKPGAVTVARFSGEDCSRYLGFAGEVLAVPTRFHGAYAEVQLPPPQRVEDLVNTAVSGGCEYHFSLAYTDHEAVLREVAYWLGIQPFPRVPHDHGAGAFSVIP